jgi:ribonuclease D
MIDNADALTAFVTRAANAPALALDTEFMREKTYRAELCLLQIADGDNAVCIDPLALTDLSSLTPLLRAPGVVKIMHAARQDLEVLLPAVGLVAPVFDTQIAAALAGHPSQVGYAELARRLLGVELAKAHTRADWSRRPLSQEEQEYALDDVRHLAALRASLLDTLASQGRVAWLEEELAALANPDALRVAPEEAWRKVKGLPSLDPARQQLVQSLAAWRERRADERNRPRGWILDDVSLREIVVRLPRSPEALTALPEMQESVVRKCGEELLTLVREATPFMPPGYVIYSTAKAALERFSTALAPELVALGITIHALRPGAVRTEQTESEYGADHDWTGWTTPEAVVPAVAFLSHQIGTTFTGQVLESTQYPTLWPEAS